MTDVKPRNHGGRRVGAGRPKKSRSSPTVLDDASLSLLIDLDTPPDLIETAARRHVRTAIGTLARKLIVGGNDAARVRAANEILDRGYGKPAVDAGGDALLPFAAMPTSGTTSVSAETRAEARKYANLAIEVLR